MHLKNIKLWNFRKYGNNERFDLKKPDLTVPFNKYLNVLIGENDSGKTAIIDSIKLVLKTHSFEWIRPSEDDFYAETSRFRIELRFEDLEEEAYHFTEWLGYDGEGAKAKPYLKVIYDVKKDKNGKITPSDICAGPDSSGSPLKAETREYLKTTYLKPLRNAETELIPKRNSRLSQIFISHPAFEGKGQDHYLIKQFDYFNQSVEKYFQGKLINEGSKDEEKDHPDQKGKELKNKIDTFINAFIDENTLTDITITEANLKSILEKLLLKISKQIKPGLGTMNRLFMASELLHLDKEDWTGLRLGLIEELEAHLHPQAQMKVIEALQKDKKRQLILTTHSPNLASKVKLENLILCHGKDVFPLGIGHTNLEDDDYRFLERFLDVTKSNLFFAKGVIMVEGWSEEILLPAIAKKMKQDGLIAKDLTEAGVSIVNVGNTEFLRYSRIFLRNEKPKMTIPIAIITDVDVWPYNKKLKIGEDGKPIEKDGNNKYDYEKRDETLVSAETTDEIKKKKEEFEAPPVEVFITEKWTLEYSLLQSKILHETVKSVLKDLHPKINLEDIEKELAKKLLGKGINKPDFANKIAEKIDPDSNKYDASIKLSESDDSLKSLMGAIKHVCN